MTTTTRRPGVGEPTPSTRTRVLDAAYALLQADGPDALTTRAVASAAKVQVPTIYRAFGDKQGLLDAVAEHGIAAYLASKAEAAPDPDPVEELRRSWDAHVAFGLANPGLFRIMNANPHAPSTIEGMRVFRARIHAVAAAGRLRTSEERALAMVRAGCIGLVTTLLIDGAGDAELISRATREAILAAISTGEAHVPPDGHKVHAAALRAGLGDAPGLSNGERSLLSELLERLSG